MIKVIHLPTTVGGNPQGISRHLNDLGVSSKTWALQQNLFGYPADKVISKKGDSRLIYELKKIFSLRYVFQCDVVFFNYGSTIYSPYYEVDDSDFGCIKKSVAKVYTFCHRLLGKLEVYAIKRMKLAVLIQYQGSDARVGWYQKKHFKINVVSQVESDFYTSEGDTVKEKQMALLTGMAGKVYALNPDLLYLLPSTAEFLPYSHVSLEEWKPYYTQCDNKVLKIGHAPTHRAAKGTKFVLLALEQLKAEGFLFELILVEGLSNSEAKEIYKTIDVLVDQLFAGWYGGLALEVMALGKPVIAYIREEDLKFIPAGMKEDLPIINADQFTIYEQLKKVITMPRTELLTLARKSRNYVETWHDPVEIAERIKRDMLIQLARISPVGN